jgi:hypothetical protein
LNHAGYGVIGGGPELNNANILAPRMAWRIAHGPPPDGLHVLHRCDNPRCVNVAHLFLGTQAENMADMASKGRQPRGARSSRALFTDDEVSAIRETYERGGISLRKLAEQFETSYSTVNRIVLRQTYA